MSTWRRWLLMLLWVPVGCSHAPTFADPIKVVNEHPRIAYQSLHPITSLPVEQDVSPPPVVCPPAATKAEEAPSPPPAPQAVTPFFVPFGQDQFHVAPDFHEWQAVLGQLDLDAHYVVVGYANAQETNAPLLAQRRAEYIASVLANEDFPTTHIRIMASWDQDATLSPAFQGVHIFPVGPGADAQDVVLRVAAQP